jgi:hypothetical protein
MQLTHLRPGYEYEVSAPLAEVLIVEGWAEPIGYDASAQSEIRGKSGATRRDRRSNVIRVGRMQTA